MIPRTVMTAALILLACFLSSPVAAEWSQDPTENNPVCIELGEINAMRVAGDGAGGMFMVWEDYRSGDADIYAQHLDAGGNPQWAVDGVAVCVAAHEQFQPDLASDGAGGALITWQDGRNGNLDIYAQLVDAGGTAVWTVDGVPVCTTPEDQIYPQVTSDGGGGAIIAWTDVRNGLSDIYAQRVTSAGAFRWADDGVAVCTASGSQSGSCLVPDGDGGAVIAWHDIRSGSFDIYAQRVDDAGFPQWAADGVAISTAVGGQVDPLIVQDQAGGAVMAWEDRRDDADGDIYAQWVDSEGNIGGPSNTPPVARATASPDTGFADLYVDFQNSSWDADGDPLEYLWEFDDPGSPSNSSTEENPRHRYESPGHYTVRLTVSDGVDEDVFTVSITVWEATISAGYTCTPSSGTVPFSTQMRTVIRNERDDQFRRAAARVSILLANGSVIGNWRAGSTTLSPGEQFGSQWFTTIPATGSVIGMNQFLLQTEDVTAPPYNQPPYAPSGNVDNAICAVTATAQ